MKTPTLTPVYPASEHVPLVTQVLTPVDAETLTAAALKQQLTLDQYIRQVVVAHAAWLRENGAEGGQAG